MFRSMPPSPSAAITTDERLRNMEYLLFQLNERVNLLQQTTDDLRAELRDAVQEKGRPFLEH
jgi:hypothetical protein